MNQLVSTEWLDKNIVNVKIFDASWHLPNANRNSYEEYKLEHIINSVFFDTDDISIISGPPLIRRKYLNILLSQINNDHVKNLQRYQKVLYQRNSLLKNIKDGKSILFNFLASSSL